MSLPSIICVTGGPRTGTHLMNSILCTSDRVTPMLMEALHVSDMLEAYRRFVPRHEKHGETLGISPEEVTQLYADWLKGLVIRMAEKFKKDFVVIRQPLLAKSIHNLRTLAGAADLAMMTVCMVRWPVDVVASMVTWVERANGVVAFDDNSVLSLAKGYEEYYHVIYKILHASDPPANGISVVRYEDLVTHPDEIVAEVGAVLGLDLSRYKRVSGWQNSLVSFAQTAPYVTPLYGAAVTQQSVGRGDATFSEADIETILNACRWLVREVYPERDPSHSNTAPLPAVLRVRA